VIATGLGASAHEASPLSQSVVRRSNDAVRFSLPRRSKIMIDQPREQMAASGTKRSWRDVRLDAAFGVKRKTSARDDYFAF
jgi:hypothetical protein